MGYNPFLVGNSAKQQQGYTLLPNQPAPVRDNPFSIVPNASPKMSNDPYRKVMNMTLAMNEVGIDVPERKPSGLSNVLSTVLNVLDRPKNVVTNLIDDLTDKEKDGVSGVLKGMWQGITGERRTDSTKIFTNLGWKDELNPDGTKKPWYKSLNNAAKGGLGFVSDVLLDPTTYLSFGTTAVGKVAGKELLEGAAKVGIKEGLEGVLKQSGEKLTEDTVGKAIAKAIGVDDIAKVNASTISNVMDKAKKNVESISEKLNMIVKDRTSLFEGVDGKALPRTKALNKLLDEADSVTHSNFLGNLDNMMKAPSRMKPRDKFDLANELVSRAGSDLEAIGKASLMTKHMTGKQLLAAKAVADAFGTKVTAIQALEFGRTLGSKSFSGKIDDLLQIGMHEATEKGLKEAAEIEIKFANGLSQVYNKVTGDVYMRYMGKEILNVSTAAGDKLAQTLNKIANFNPVAKVINPVADLLGHTFKTAYVSRAVRNANPERAAQLKQFFEVTQAMIQKETGIPKHAVEAVLNTFDDDILHSPKIRRAITYFIEKDIADGGFDAAVAGSKNYAAKKWEEIAATLTPEELKLVEKGAVQHTMLMSAIRELDKAISKYANEVGDDASSQYVKHYYRQSPSEVEDIVSAMTREQRVGAKTATQGGFDKNRRFQSIAAAEALTEGRLKAIDDILVADALRYMESWRVLLNQQLGGVMEKIANSTDDMVGIISKNKVDGYVKLDGFQYLDQATGRHNTYYVHTDVARELKRFTDVFTDDIAMNKWLSYVDKITNMIKATQTSMNPGFLAKNVFGETFMNFMAGVDIKSHALAQDILNNVGKHKITRVGNRVLYHDGNELKILADIIKEEWVNDAGVKSVAYKAKGIDGKIMDLEGNLDVPLINERYEDFVTQQLKKVGVKTYNIGGKEMTADQILNQFYDLGLGWSGITKGDIVNNMEDTIKKQMKTLSPIQKLNPFTHMANIGDWTETWTRLSHMLDRVQKGYSFKEAALDVRKYHVDYRDLTPMERNVFRRIAPYYTYMRKNLPIQLRTMLMQPGKFAAIGKLVNMSYAGLQDVNNMPDYAREDLAIPLFEHEDGNITYINWGLPITDLARLKYDLGELWRTNVLDMMHPAIKAQFELTTNSNIGLGGMPIEKFEGEKTQIIPGVGQPIIPRKADYMLQQLGIVQNLRKTLGEFVQPDDPMKPDSPIPLMSSVIKTVNPTQVRDANMYQYAEQLQNFKSRLQQAGIAIPSTEDYERIRKLRMQGYNNPFMITPTN